MQSEVEFLFCRTIPLSAAVSFICSSKSCTQEGGILSVPLLRSLSSREITTNCWQESE